MASKAKAAFNAKARAPRVNDIDNPPLLFAVADSHRVRCVAVFVMGRVLRLRASVPAAAGASRRVHVAVFFRAHRHLSSRHRMRAGTAAPDAVAVMAE